METTPPPEGGLVEPRKNANLLGQEQAESALLADYQSGRFPHAIVFAGPPGIGKATMAFRLTRFLLDNRQEENGPSLFGDAAPPTSLHIDPESAVFRQVASGGHPDLLTIARKFDDKRGKAKSEISVEDVRKITPFLHKTAAQGGWRVVIVDEGEALNRNAQNALLKNLEEPPARTVLILVTSQPGRLLPTIRSRCRMMYFNSIPESDVVSLLRTALPDTEEASLQILARMSEGSAGRALQLAQEGGIDLYQLLLSALEELPQPSPVSLHHMADRFGQYGADQSYKTLMSLLLWWLGRMARYQAVGQLPPEVLEGETAILQRLANVYSPKIWLDMQEKVTRLYNRSEFAALDKRLTVLTLFQELAA